MSRVSDSLYNAAIPNLTVTFTTDDPGITANSQVTIADGDAAAVAVAEFNEFVVEVSTKMNAMLDAMRASGVIKDSGEAATPTVASYANIEDLTVAYTTDDPAITPDGTLTIADGDASTVTRAEYNELAEEVAAKLNAILQALRGVGILAD